MSAVKRFSIAQLRFAGGKEHDVNYVSEVHYDAALAREAQLRVDRDDDANTFNLAMEKLQRSNAELRDELGAAKGEYDRAVNKVDALQQRLTRGKAMSRQEQIRQLAMTDPIVKSCLDMQRDPGVLYEDALEMMVIALADQHATALAELLAIIQRSLPPTVIVTVQGIDAIRTAYYQSKTLPVRES